MKYAIPAVILVIAVAFGAMMLTSEPEKDISMLAETVEFQIACVAKYQELKSLDSLTVEQSEQFEKLRKEIDGFIDEYPDSLQQEWRDEIR